MDGEGEMSGDGGGDNEGRGGDNEGRGDMKMPDLVWMLWDIVPLQYTHLHFAKGSNCVTVESSL